MSSSDSPPNGPQAVRNLRAKFEEQCSPSPTRGRSPATSRHASTDGSNASQTRNTVRTSFVPVELIKPEMDDRRITPEACIGSTAHKRRESFSMDESTDPKAMAQLRGTISSELERRMKSSLIEPVPEVAVVTPAIERGESELFPKMKKPVERPSGLLKQEVAGNEAIESASEDDEGSGQTIEPVDKPTSEDNTPSLEKQEDSTPEKIQEASAPNQGKNTANESQTGVKEPTRTPGSVGSKSVNSPSTGAFSSKRISGPSRVSVTGSGSRTTTERTTRTTSRSNLPVTPTASGKPSAKDNTRRRPVSQINKPEVQNTASTSATTRARARTKSPTRPVKLPQSATAPTASSVAKTSAVSTLNGGSHPGPARLPSGTTQNNNNIRRQPSKREPTKSIVPKGPSTSNVGENRALPHRPVDSGAPKRQASKVERNTSGGGFLARMMRPTVSSAGKVHDKPTNAPKTGPTNERTTTGKTKQTDKRKGEANSVREPASVARAVSEQASEDREQVTDHKGQVTENKEQVTENKGQVSETGEPVSESTAPHEEIPANGNVTPSSKEEPAVAEDDGKVEKGQDDQGPQPVEA